MTCPTKKTASSEAIQCLQNTTNPRKWEETDPSSSPSCPNLAPQRRRRGARSRRANIAYSGRFYASAVDRKRGIEGLEEE